MIQENKELLLKDLCCRLPYGVKCTFNGKNIYKVYGIDEVVNDDGDWEYAICTKRTSPLYISDCKPYLFPLSSMTEEQKKELSKLGVSYGEYALHDDTRGLGIMVDEVYIFFEFCYKHHIDFLGLIEMGLAINATGLNIY